VAKRILVPLDRSAASEAVLPFVADIARGAGSTVRLVNVQPVPETVVAEYGRVVAYQDQEMERLQATGEVYLQGAEALLDGVPTERVVRFGDPAHEILAEADDWDADLVVMAEGRSRSWWPRGRGVSARVARRGSIPTLRYRPGRTG
jgi:nucleotide-binding universal stress UspA family protein